MTKKLSMLVCCALVALDQLVKAWALTGLTYPNGRITVIPGLFYLTYVENRGAAFGLFQGATILLATLSVVVITALLAAVLTDRITEPFLVWSISLIIAGGAGNCIDRFFRGFVVDYLDFSALFGFPVFNLADCCVVCGAGLILVYALFIENRKEPSAGTKTAEAPGHEEA